MSFRKRINDPDFIFNFFNEDGELLFTMHGKNEVNDNCYLVTTPLYENPNNLAMYYLEEESDVLRFMKDVYGVSEEDLDAAISGAEIEAQSEDITETEPEESSFVPGPIDASAEEAEFGEH